MCLISEKSKAKCKNKQTKNVINILKYIGYVFLPDVQLKLTTHGRPIGAYVTDVVLGSVFVLQVFA